MIGKSTPQTRLCPYCANSIQEDAAKCNYCKAELSSDDAPEWLKRDGSPSESRIGLKSARRFSLPAKFIWPGAMLFVALSAFFAGGYMRRSELSSAMQANLKQLQTKDQMIQSQEAQLAQTRQQLEENSKQLAATKTQLEENDKKLSAAEQRLGAASREVNRLSANRPVATRRTASRTPDPASSSSQPAARRTAEPGVYETTQATAVYDNPSASARVISQIGSGTRINVVGSTGGWLEVRSNRGNPPGFVRSEDARRAGRATREAPRRTAQNRDPAIERR